MVEAVRLLLQQVHIPVSLYTVGLLLLHPLDHGAEAGVGGLQRGAAAVTAGTHLYMGTALQSGAVQSGSVGRYSAV